MVLFAVVQSFWSAVYSVPFSFCAAAMKRASYIVMFWVKAICVVSCVISRVVTMFSPSYILMRSSIVDVASSGFRSLIRFACFHITLKLSAKAMSTV